jgi:hypothetical protein
MTPGKVVCQGDHLRKWFASQTTWARSGQLDRLHRFAKLTASRARIMHAGATEIQRFKETAQPPGASPLSARWAVHPKLDRSRVIRRLRRRARLGRANQRAR